MCPAVQCCQDNFTPRKGRRSKLEIKNLTINQIFPINISYNLKSCSFATKFVIFLSNFIYYLNTNRSIRVELLAFGQKIKEDLKVLKNLFEFY